MKVISKSKYTKHQTCPKLLWLTENRPDLFKPTKDHAKQIRDGKEVGEYAKKYFDNVVDVTTLNDDGSLNIQEMIGLTNRYLLEGGKIIAEATFSIDGLFCSVDLLKPVDGGYELIEVKATTEVKKEHYPDVAFQAYLLSKRGLNIKAAYVMHLDNTYIRHGDLNLHQLFKLERVDDDSKYLQAMMNMEDVVKEMRDIALRDIEPDHLLFSKCSECPFKGHCQENVPVPSVLDINNLKGRYDLYNSGVVSYLDVLTCDKDLNKRQKAQIEAYLHNKEVIVDKTLLNDFISELRYPIYHLDFESIELPIPPADGTWVYEQIPTQYSLHIEYADGRVEHKEFLGETINPKREVAEALCRDIPMGSCILAYFKTFECGRLKELAEAYDDLRDHLMDLHDHVIDLIVPFKQGAYYHKAMGGSNSIKAVLPALYPNDPDLDYHALPVVHHGGEAMDIYPKMINADPVEQQRIRDGLLKYCCLDTLAMAKVLRKLKEAVK